MGSTTIPSIKEESKTISIGINRCSLDLILTRRRWSWCPTTSSRRSSETKSQSASRGWTWVPETVDSWITSSFFSMECTHGYSGTISKGSISSKLKEGRGQRLIGAPASNLPNGGSSTSSSSSSPSTSSGSKLPTGTDISSLRSWLTSARPSCNTSPMKRCQYNMCSGTAQANWSTIAADSKEIIGIIKMWTKTKTWMETKTQRKYLRDILSSTTLIGSTSKSGLATKRESISTSREGTLPIWTTRIELGLRSLNST